MASLDKKKKSIAIFASGSGSNAERIIQYFKEHTLIQVSLIISNIPQAGIIQKANNHSLPVEIVKKDQYTDAEYMISLMEKYQIEFIVLAGYLKLIRT